MTYKHILHTNGAVGIADIPDWLNFEEQPPRSFGVKWIYPNPQHNSATTTTTHTRPITKEVADIIMSLNNV